MIGFPGVTLGCVRATAAIFGGLLIPTVAVLLGADEEDTGLETLILTALLRLLVLTPNFG